MEPVLCFTWAPRKQPLVDSTTDQAPVDSTGVICVEPTWMRGALHGAGSPGIHRDQSLVGSTGATCNRSVSRKSHLFEIFVQATQLKSADEVILNSLEG